MKTQRSPNKSILKERKSFLGYEEVIHKRSFEKWIKPLEILQFERRVSRRSGERLSRKRRKEILNAPFNVPNFAGAMSAQDTALKVSTAARMMKNLPSQKIIVNDIGCGCNLLRDKNKIPSGTYEPFFIAGKLEGLGKKYEVRAFALNPREISTAKRQKSVIYEADNMLDNYAMHRTASLLMWPARGYNLKSGSRRVSMRIPQKILKNVKFNPLDIITETPAQQADITTIRGIPIANNVLSTTDEKEMAMLKNAVDSTKKNGYVIFDFDPYNYMGVTHICRMFGLKHIESGIFQKK